MEADLPGFCCCFVDKFSMLYRIEGVFYCNNHQATMMIVMLSKKNNSQPAYISLCLMQKNRPNSPQINMEIVTIYVLNWKNTKGKKGK